MKSKALKKEELYSFNALNLAIFISFSLIFILYPFVNLVHFLHSQKIYLVID